MADDLAKARPARSGRDIVRYLLGIAVGVIVLVVLFGKRGELAAAVRQLGDADLRWTAVAIAAESLSLLTYAYLQQHVLGLSGSRQPLGWLFLLSLANDAIACTVPGEPAVSSAYRYRYYRRRGATGAASGWTVFTILIAQAIGMSLLLLLGVVVALAGSASAGNAATAVVGLVIVVAAVLVLVRRDLVLRLAGALVRGVRRVTGHPRGSVGARIDSTLARMREIPLSARSTVVIVAIAAAVWGCDFLCLLASFGAVGARVPWSGVLLAYGVAQVAGSLPIVPGGIGIVEGSLAVILAFYGTQRTDALSTALAYRVVNFWLAVAVGWISVGVIAQRTRRLDRRSGAPETHRAAFPDEDRAGQGPGGLGPPLSP